jgi:hypothetical protein
MQGTIPRLITIGVIAAELGKPPHRIEYVLRTRPHIRPAAYAGTVRLFDRNAVALVKHELDQIAARQRRKAVRHEQ